MHMYSTLFIMIWVWFSRLRSRGVTRGCVVSPTLLDVHVLWRHNCRLSLCCDAPLLGERTSCRMNWMGVAFILCRRWCHCRLYFCVLPCLTRTMYGFETYSELKQASRMGGGGGGGGVWGSSYSRTLMPCGAVLRNVCIHIFSLFFLTSVVRSGWPAIRLRIVGIGCACVAAVLCEFRLKCLATGVSLLCRMSARCSLNRVRKFRFVSPIYCFLQRVHSRR